MLHSPVTFLSPKDISQGLCLENPSAKGGQVIIALDSKISREVGVTVALLG